MDSKDCCDSNIVDGRRMMCSVWKSGSNNGKGTDAKMHVKSVDQCENDVKVEKTMLLHQFIILIWF